MRPTVVEQPAITLLTMLIFKAEMHAIHLVIINEQYSPVMLGWSFGSNCDQDCSENVAVQIYGCWCPECSWNRHILLPQKWKCLFWFILVHSLKPYLMVTLIGWLGIDSDHVFFPTAREHWEVKKKEFRNPCGLSELKAALQADIQMRALVIHISAVSWEIQ